MELVYKREIFRCDRHIATWIDGHTEKFLLISKVQIIKPSHSDPL